MKRKTTYLVRGEVAEVVPGLEILPYHRHEVQQVSLGNSPGEWYENFVQCMYMPACRLKRAGRRLQVLTSTVLQHAVVHPTYGTALRFLCKVLLSRRAGNIVHRERDAGGVLTVLDHGFILVDRGTVSGMGPFQIQPLPKVEMSKLLWGICVG